MQFANIQNNILPCSAVNKNDHKLNSFSNFIVISKEAHKSTFVALIIKLPQY